MWKLRLVSFLRVGGANNLGMNPHAECPIIVSCSVMDAYNVNRKDRNSCEPMLFVYCGNELPFSVFSMYYQCCGSRGTTQLSPPPHGCASESYERTMLLSEGGEECNCAETVWEWVFLSSLQKQRLCIVPPTLIRSGLIVHRFCPQVLIRALITLMHCNACPNWLLYPQWNNQLNWIQSLRIPSGRGLRQCIFNVHQLTQSTFSVDSKNAH